MEILPREWWGARPNQKPYVYFPDHKYWAVEAHHSATRQDIPFSQAMRDIQGYHLSLGWTDIFYSFAIYKDGRIAEGRGWNKGQGNDTRWDPDGGGPALPGKVCPIVFIGNYENDPWTPAQLDSWNWMHSQVLERQPAALYRRYHGMRASTACPGANIKNSWSVWSDLDRLPTEVPEMGEYDQALKYIAAGINELRDDLTKLIEKPYQVSPQRHNERKLLEAIYDRVDDAAVLDLREES